MESRENRWIIGAEYYKDYKIKLVFDNGVKGVVDLENDIDQPIFQPLKDLEFFKDFTLNSWTIEWENGADFAPEFLYNHVVELIDYS